MVYIACFAVSQGAVVWVYISEVFPTGSVKGSEPGKFIALDNERRHLPDISSDGSVSGRLPLYIFRRDDGARFFPRPVLLPRDQQNIAGADAKAAGI